MWPNFQRHHSGKRVVVRREAAIGKNFERGAFGILESHGLANAGCDVAAPLALDAGFFQPRNDFAGIAVRRDLKRQPRRCHGAVALEHDRLKAGFGGEDRAIFFTRDKA